MLYEDGWAPVIKTAFKERPAKLLAQLRDPVFCKYMGRMSLGAAL
jgi:hypothetical protein